MLFCLINFNPSNGLVLFVYLNSVLQVTQISHVSFSYHDVAWVNLYLPIAYNNKIPVFIDSALLLSLFQWKTKGIIYWDKVQQNKVKLLSIMCRGSSNFFLILMHMDVCVTIIVCHLIIEKKKKSTEHKRMSIFSTSSCSWFFFSGEKTSGE